MWEISDLDFEDLKQVVKQLKECDDEEWSNNMGGRGFAYMAGTLHGLLPCLLEVVKNARPSEHGMTDSDLNRLEEEVGAKR